MAINEGAPEGMTPARPVFMQRITRHLEKKNDKKNKVGLLAFLKKLFTF